MCMQENSTTVRTLNLNSIESVKEFVNIVGRFEFFVDLGSGRHIIDAKSIMGIFSLDLSKPVVITIHAEESRCSTLLEQISKFIA